MKTRLELVLGNGFMLVEPRKLRSAEFKVLDNSSLKSPSMVCVLEDGQCGVLLCCVHLIILLCDRLVC